MSKYFKITYGEPFKRIFLHRLIAVPLKGTVSRDFLLLVFFMNQFPPSIPFTPFQIFSKIPGDIRVSRCTTGINDTGGKFVTSISDTGGKFFLHFCLRCWYRRQICHRCQRTGGKFATGVNDAGGKLPPVSMTPASISGCRHLKVNLKAKIYIYVNSTTQRYPNKII